MSDTAQTFLWFASSFLSLAAFTFYQARAGKFNSIDGLIVLVWTGAILAGPFTAACCFLAAVAGLGTHRRQTIKRRLEEAQKEAYAARRLLQEHGIDFNP